VLWLIEHPEVVHIFWLIEYCKCFNLQIPEAEASIQDIAVDPEGSYMAAVSNRGHCYIWSLTGGVGEEPIKLNPKLKIVAHKRYALKCKFSPDST
jgi:G protein beta subunit-like protein